MVARLLISIVVLCLVNNFATVDNSPDPSDDEDGKEHLEDSVHNSGAGVFSITSVDDGSPSWEEDVQDKADIGHTDIGLGDNVIRAAHKYFILLIIKILHRIY